MGTLRSGRLAVVPREFVRESNRIENIVRVPTAAEMQAHERLLSLDALTVEAVEEFVTDVAARPLRRAVGQDVIVGGYRPPPGGPEIEEALGTDEPSGDGERGGRVLPRVEGLRCPDCAAVEFLRGQDRMCFHGEAPGADAAHAIKEEVWLSVSVAGPRVAPAPSSSTEGERDGC